MLQLNNGMKIPKLGQGTWKMGEPSSHKAEEIATLQRGIDLGLTLLDTAEMYGNGRSEQRIAEAIVQIPREKLILVSKVLPDNAGKADLGKSLDRSLSCLNTDYLDLYLLHWRGRIPLEETIEAMEAQVSAGKIRAWGVSNFDTEDMKELLSLPQGKNCQVNQVLYHLGSRGVEFDLMPYLEQENIPLMAYCPLAQAGKLKEGMLNTPVVKELAKTYGCQETTILLAFSIQQDIVFSIPKASTVAHVEENAKALAIRFTPEEAQALDKAFPKPVKKTYLDLL